MIQGLLGPTVFNNLQIVVEITLILLLSTNLGKILKKRNILLIFVFTFSSVISFIINPFSGFMLNAKIFLICILTLFYFEDKYHGHFRYIEYFILLNVLYIYAFQFFGVNAIENLNFFSTNYTRPHALFGVPHNAAYVLSIYIIYLLLVKKWIRVFLVFNGLLFISSFTSILAVLGQISYYIVNKIKKINSIIFLLLSLSMLYMVKEIILERDCKIWAHVEDGETVWSSDCKYKSHIPRWYSLEVMLPQIFDYKYWIEIFNLYPQPYSTYILDNYKGRWNNEIGLIKVFIEGGFMLALLLLTRFYIKFKIMIVFLFLCSLHYMYIVNIPFSLYLALQCMHRINIYKSYY